MRSLPESWRYSLRCASRSCSSVLAALLTSAAGSLLSTCPLEDAAVPAPSAAGGWLAAIVVASVARPAMSAQVMTLAPALPAVLGSIAASSWMVDERTSVSRWAGRLAAAGRAAAGRAAAGRAAAGSSATRWAAARAAAARVAGGIGEELVHDVLQHQRRLSEGYFAAGMQKLIG